MAASWFPAVAHQSAQAVQINQFLKSHTCQYLYDGAAVTSNAAGTGTASSATWLAQQFTGVTACGLVTLPLAIVGTTTPVTISIYSGSTAPAAKVVSCTIPVLPAAATVAVPLPATLTSTSTYWVVMAALGTSADGWTWGKGTAAAGGMTSTDGVTWTAAGYSLQFAIADQSATGNLRAIVYDGDPQSRAQMLDYDGSGNLVTIRDTVGGTALTSTGVVSYTSGTPTAVSAS